jgi:hypothetical protein
MRRNQVHIPGIVEFRMVGTVVALQEGSFSVNNDPDGPMYFVLANPWIADVKVGDRVEIEPRSASSRTSGRWNVQSSPDWVLTRNSTLSKRVAP